MMQNQFNMDLLIDVLEIIAGKINNDELNFAPRNQGLHRICFYIRISTFIEN